MLSRLKFEIDVVINEMLDQIPKEQFISSTTTFFDPDIGGGQFLKEIEARLRKHGHSDKNIKSRVFGMVGNILAKNYAINMNNVISNIEVGNFIEKDINMKFDNIVGNPPYNDSSVGNIPIYHLFIEKCCNYATNIALIIPAASARSNERYGDSIRANIFNKNTKKIKFLPIDTFNATVNTMFFILDKSTVFSNTIIDTLTTTSCLSAENNEYIWHDEILHSVLRKCGSDNARESWIKFNRRDKNKQHKMVKANTVIEINKDCIIHEVILGENDPHLNEHRVVTSFLPNAKYHLDVLWYVPKNIAVKIGYTTTTVKTKKEGLNLIRYLKSDLIKFIYQSTKTSRTLRTPQLKFVPLIDLTRSWSDSEIYEHFKLTQKEISYIESFVK